MNSFMNLFIVFCVGGIALTEGLLQAAGFVFCVLGLEVYFFIDKLKEVANNPDIRIQRLQSERQEERAKAAYITRCLYEEARRNSGNDNAYDDRGQQSKSVSFDEARQFVMDLEKGVDHVRSAK